ncbi:MAG: helix-turn-helix domain-containing protein [Brevundimonas sp.]|uniref:helix-turn-helix domain-containing protein n=1 Tax=Brevundimonas sp. TaxID=1871086 RepID=UPI002604B73C|nr:helix-turn-helix domain-containing protein [Brevundimonas sp.]MDI6623489.1 helix-turn-helix domain-containing protein [Brevundimonas sp.]
MRAPSVGSGLMALDTGNNPEEFRDHPDWKDVVPSVTDAPTLGDGLRIARTHSGRSLAELSSITRVPARYLTALEQNDFSVLPNRVFSIGYVRAYAGALGLDEQLAVERFKREAPDPSVPLQPPVGVAFEEVKRYSPRLIAAGLALVLAVVGWNVFQRVSLMRAPEPSDIAAVPESWTLGAVPGQEQFMRLTAPRPAPPDQTVPALYITPGLEAELTGIDPASPEGLAAAAAGAPPVQKAFNPRGAIYGASANASQVVLQARKSAYLIVRMADGRVLFARQLVAGDAWRAPVGVAATVEVQDVSAFDVYLNGEHGGALGAAQTSLNQLNARAQSLARQAAAEITARTEAARTAAVQARAQAQLQASSVQNAVSNAAGG